ncbi:MAG: YgjP-like metallopeptidase domain-containing protein, partial [Gammaproteobacteria bacterium]
MLSIYQNTWPGMSTLQCNDFEVTLTRKRIKNINLRISRDGSVHISAPLRASIHNIQQFIEQKQNWIRTHRDQILARAIPKNHAFNTGDLYPFLGQDYSVIIHEHSQQEGITFEKPYISCYVKAQATLELKQ